MNFFASIPTHMDYDGQARSEKFSRIIITLFGKKIFLETLVEFFTLPFLMMIVGLVWGYVIQQFSETVYILGAGFILAAILTIPPWPMYQRKPLNWQKPRPTPRTEESSSDSQTAKSRKKK